MKLHRRHFYSIFDLYMFIRCFISPKLNLIFLKAQTTFFFILRIPFYVDMSKDEDNDNETTHLPPHRRK